jgi:predicted ribosome quality control (RQC) complex YloA/Tae2 family protein
VVATDGISLVRKSQQGTYTKKKPLEIPIPAWPPASGEVEIFGLNDFLNPSSISKESAKPSAAESGSPAKATLAPLSPEQKEARDRVARRYKTLKKSLARYIDAPVIDLSLLERQAHALKANFHLLAPLSMVADPVLEVEDLEGSMRIPLKPFDTPATWLQEAFDELRRSQKKQVIHAQEQRTLEISLGALARALETLRSQPLAPPEISQIMGSLSLAPKQNTINSLTRPHAHQPYRVFKLPILTDPSKPPRDFLIHVGKSAMDSDQLVKHAKGNDLWLHAVGATGSHVIIPSAPFSEGAKQGRVDDPLIFAAAVLALYYSKSRDQKNQDSSSGEVYFSRRHHIKKRKGMAPGLWQIDQASTLGIRYTAQDLERILNLMSPS